MSDRTEIILLLEDENEIRKLVKKFLEALGYGVLEPADPNEALSLCKEYKEPIHLVLTDVLMPQMSGPQLVDRLRHLRKDFKVLYMSGNVAEALAHQTILKEGVGFIQKPFSLAELARKVRESLSAC